MEEAALDRLADDIEANGVREPIWLHPDGRVLDGRNRALACKRLGVPLAEVPSRTYEGDDPLAFVLSLNLHRRHLTSDQKAAVAVSIEEYEAEAARERQLATLKKGDEKPVPESFPEREKGEARDKAAEKVGTNPRYVSDAKRIKNDAPDVFERMKTGGYGSMNRAREVAKLPPEDRADVNRVADEARALPPKDRRRRLRKVMNEKKEELEAARRGERPFEKSRDTSSGVGGRPQPPLTPARAVGMTFFNLGRHLTTSRGTFGMIHELAQRAADGQIPRDQVKRLADGLSAYAVRLQQYADAVRRGEAIPLKQTDPVHDA
jgi:hypothetical protein